MECAEIFQVARLKKYSSVKIQRSAALMGADHKDIEKYPELLEILEIHALNLELKKTIKEAKTNETNRNQKQCRPS